MTETEQFAWTDRLKALSKVDMIDGSVGLLPPHVPRRVVSLENSDDVTVEMSASTKSRTDRAE